MDLFIWKGQGTTSYSALSLLRVPCPCSNHAFSTFPARLWHSQIQLRFLGTLINEITKGKTPKEWTPKLKTLSALCSCIFFSPFFFFLSCIPGPSILFPIKLNSLLTGVRHSHQADRIRAQYFLSANNHRSLHSKSVGNGVWTLRISSVYPFYLFLICINGNSVGFNLCDSSRLWSSGNTIFLLVNHWVHGAVAAKRFWAHKC